MKKLLLIFMLGLGVLYAQKGDIKWGFLLSPQINDRILLNVTYDGFRDGEYADLGYSIGVFGLKTLSEKKEFEFGLHYSNKGYRDYLIGRFGDQIDPNNGFVGDPVVINFKYNYNYLCFPLKLNLFAGKKSYFAFALQPEILISTSFVSWIDAERSSRKMENIKPFSASLSLGYGREFQFNSFALRIEPIFNVNFINLYKESVVSEHLFNIGLNTKWIIH